MKVNPQRLRLALIDGSHTAFGQRLDDFIQEVLLHQIAKYLAPQSLEALRDSYPTTFNRSAAKNLQRPQSQYKSSVVLTQDPCDDVEYYPTISKS